VRFRLATPAAVRGQNTIIGIQADQGQLPAKRKQIRSLIEFAQMIRLFPRLFPSAGEGIVTFRTS
jgi:hypothetical protein